MKIREIEDDRPDKNAPDVGQTVKFECTPTDCTMCEAYPDPDFSKFPPDCEPRKRGEVRCVIQGEEVID